MIDKTESAVETLRSMDVSQRYSMPWDISPKAYKDLLDRVMDAPVDADGEVLHVGDEYSVWPNRERVHVIEELSIDDDGRWYIVFQRMPQGPDVIAYCSQVYRVMPDSRERIEADAERRSPECADLVRRCFALMDGEGR